MNNIKILAPSIFTIFLLVLGVIRGIFEAFMALMVILFVLLMLWAYFENKKLTKETYNKYGDITHIGGFKVYSENEFRNYIDENDGFVKEISVGFCEIQKTLFDKEGNKIGIIISKMTKE